MWTNYYIFLIAAGVFVALGLYFFFRQGTQTSHFSGISIKPTSATTLETQVFISGQYKTVGKGFCVGKRIAISALLYFKDKQQYDQFKNLPEGAKFVGIDNSEAPEDANRDISRAIQEGNINKPFTNPGTIKMTKFYDDKKP